MADNKDNDSPNKETSDEILFEAPSGLPSWALELDNPNDIAPPPDPFDPSSEMALPPPNFSSNTINGSDVDQHSNSVVTTDHEVEPILEPIKSDDDRVEAPTLAPAFLQDGQFTLPAEEIAQPSPIATNIETPVIESAIANQVASIAKDETITDPVFELPAGEPEFLQNSVAQGEETPSSSTIEKMEKTGRLSLVSLPIDEQSDSTNQELATILAEAIPPVELKIEPTEKVGGLESLIANIDQNISYLDFDLNTYSTKDSSATEVTEQYISFFLAGTNYAIAARNVTEMNRVPKITFVPNVTDWLIGITNLRGDILSIIDLRQFFGLTPLPRHDVGRLLVIRNNNSSLITGIIVDEVKGLREVPVAKISSLPDFYLAERLKPFFKGLYQSEKELLVLLDIELFLASPELRQFELI